MDWSSLPISFYERPVTQVARDLIGCLLVSDVKPRLCARIVEAEAYGMDEEAFFGRHVRLTPQGEVTTSDTGKVLLGARGAAFVYSVYFGNLLLNIVAGPQGYLGCVLLRAAEPLEGASLMRRRRGTEDPDVRLAAGPGRLTQAFAIDKSLNGHSMQEPPLRLCARRPDDTPEIVAGPRIGVKRALDLDWRFVDRASAALSRPAPRIIADRHMSP